MPSPIFVAIYTRFSPRPNAEDCDSCERQLERCEAYCKKRGYPLPSPRGVYSDENVSGGDLDRPRLSVAIENMARATHCSPRILVVDTMSRLARDMLVALTIRHKIEQAGGRIEYADGTPTATTPEGELFTNILAAFAAYERARICHATSRGIKRRQENGEWFGRPPVGWMRDPKDSKKLVPCEQERAAIYKARLLAGIVPSEGIAKFLTQEFGLFRGKPWSQRTIRKILAQSDETL